MKRPSLADVKSIISLEGYQSSEEISSVHNELHIWWSRLHHRTVAGEWRQTSPVHVTATEPRISICEYLCIFIYSSCIFYVLVCAEMYTHTHTLWIDFSFAFIRRKSCSSLCSVLSAAVPRHSVNKLAGSRRAGCLLVGYELVAVIEGVLKNYCMF